MVDRTIMFLSIILVSRKAAIRHLFRYFHRLFCILRLYLVLGLTIPKKLTGFEIGATTYLTELFQILVLKMHCFLDRIPLTGLHVFRIGLSSNTCATASLFCIEEAYIFKTIVLFF